MQLLVDPQTPDAVLHFLAFMEARARTGRNDMSYRIVPSGACRLVCPDGTVRTPPARANDVAALLVGEGEYASASPSCAATTDEVASETAVEYPPPVDATTVVLFHSPHCPHCVRFMPQWEELRHRVSDAIHLLAIDAQQHPQLAHAAHVRGVPHLEVHVKGTVHLYGGARTAEALLGFIRSLMSEPHMGEPSDSKQVRVVWFHAPWCGHCKRMRPAWDDAATDGRVQWTAVDCDADPDAAAKEGVEGFPTIRAYAGGKMLMEHDGPRDAAALRDFATRALQMASNS